MNRTRDREVRSSIARPSGRSWQLAPNIAVQCVVTVELLNPAKDTLGGGGVDHMGEGRLIRLSGYENC